MATVIDPTYGEVVIPGWVTDLDAFRRWVRSGTLPEKLAVHFIRGEVWVDFSMEEAFSHNRVKLALYRTVGDLAEAEQLGAVFTDGMLLTNDEADLGVEPDMIFVSAGGLAAGRVRFTAGKTTGAEATEMVGTPDLVAEVVSPSSVDKDTEKLMSQYHDAGIPEYWVIDARGGAIRFDVYKRGPKGYVATRKADGWVRSKVLGRSFRLIPVGSGLRVPGYKLEAR